MKTAPEKITTTVILKVSPEDKAIIGKIVHRYCELERSLGLEPVDEIYYALDLIACHANGCPLRLQALLDADDCNLAHDIVGIGLHLNRTTGKLKNCFLPRFAEPQPRMAAI